MKNTILFLTTTYVMTVHLSATVLFSNEFEDGNFDPEIGSWTFDANSSIQSVVATATTDTTLGTNVGLIDRAGTTSPSTALGLSLGLTSTGSLDAGATVNIDFDFAARRTGGNARTIFVDALDSNGDIVVRLVLGDASAFGNGNSDRQRPGYDPTSGGNTNAVNTANSLFPGPNDPGSFWWGSDGTTDNFDVNRDGHISLSINASSFDFSTTSQNGNTYSTTGLANRDAGTFADIASVEFSSAGINHGFFIDNLIIEAVPEPSSAALLSFAGLSLLMRRKR